jgi:hypothetical protein
MPVFQRRVLCGPAVAFVLLCALQPAVAVAQPSGRVNAASPATQPAPSIAGQVTTQNGTIELGGASVVVKSGTVDVATTFTDADGTFRVDTMPPGSYTVVIALDGFDPNTQTVVVTAGQSAQVKSDLRISAVSERVEVVASTAIVPAAGTLSSTDGLTGRELDEITGGGGLASALRLLASIIEVPGGVSIKGGRPSQASVQLGTGAFVDPATGLSQVSLPDDAIDSVTVLPNPYAVEYGRFSSGLVLIRTRRAGDVWKTRLNNLEPSFRVRRGSPWRITGISALSPRAETGGPLIRDKLFLQQAIQYRYRTNDVQSRPQDELKRSHRFSSFTRTDAVLSPRHSLIGAVGFFPSRAEQATLGTFTPPDASVDMKGNASTASVTERALWSDRLFTETTFEIHGYGTDVMPRGPAAMELFPETTLGNFFNRQHREATTFQVVESMSGSSNGRLGLHLYKAGIDLLHTRYSSMSASRTVFVRRTDGTLARRLDFSPAMTTQQVNATDLAVYAQDRVQPGARWYAEYGARLDRDGVLGLYNVTPRVGGALLLKADGSSVIRSGFGLFFERTPSIAGAFDRYEGEVDSRFASDGATLLQPPTPFAHVVDPDIRTARSRTWDLAFDHRFNAFWSIHASGIERRGRHELLVNESVGPEGGSWLLNSRGRSEYREAEVGARFTAGNSVDLNLSYVRSVARSDLNEITSYYDAVLWPIVGKNGYGPAKTEVPHRLLARGRARPLPNWLLVGTLDWRSGLPYSTVDQWLDFTGPRNSRRFPAYVRVDAGLEHRFAFGKLRPWIGLRVDNALGSFLPSDVQTNISSPALGTFYNTEYRQARIQVRFER